MIEGRPSVEKLPRRFWEMIIEHCPNLEELTIGGVAPSPRIFDIQHVTHGRWPRLHSLTLGDMVLQSGNGKDQQNQNRSSGESQSFTRFLVAHPSLQSIAFQHSGGHNFPPSFFLPHSALLRITSFSGPPKYVTTLPNPALLQDLTLTSLHHSVMSFPPTCAILKSLPSLVSLSIWIDLSFANRKMLHDDEYIFRTLLESCPQLIHLDVKCFTRPTFHIVSPPSSCNLNLMTFNISQKEFVAALRHAPRLQSFSLTKTYKPSNEDMIRTATRIAIHNPNLRKFTLCYAQDAWLTHSGGRTRQVGDYEIVTDTSGVPLDIFAHERGFRAFGIAFSRRYAQALQPPTKSRQGHRSSQTSLLSARPKGPHLFSRPHPQTFR